MNHPNIAKKILICSYAFWPSLGGLELTSEKLAFWLLKQGYDVTVLTFTELDNNNEDKFFPFHIVRNPSFLHQISLFIQSDIIISKHLALKCCWPILLLKKPFLIWHATWYKENERRLIKTIRTIIIKRAINVANSKAIGESLEQLDGIIHPGYDEKNFNNTNSWDNREGIAFLGRLSAEKGCSLLIDALSQLKNENLYIIGAGAEEENLRKQVADLNLLARVHFLGRKDAVSCSDILNKVKVLVVPSIYNEPFGTVALEGLASGCRVVVSNGGGLPDAAGPTGIIFQSDSVDSLVESIKFALSEPLSKSELRKLNQHLVENKFDKMAAKLMILLKSYI